MNFFWLIIVYVILNATGQVFIKMGSLQLIESYSFRDVIVNFRLIFGVFLFGLSFLTWIFILTKASLSYAFPFAVGLGYVSVIGLSVLILKENISGLQWLGIFLVGIGIIIISAIPPQSEI